MRIEMNRKNIVTIFLIGFFWIVPAIVLLFYSNEGIMLYYVAIVTGIFFFGDITSTCMNDFVISRNNRIKKTIIGFMFLFIYGLLPSVGITYLIAYIFHFSYSATKYMAIGSIVYFCLLLLRNKVLFWRREGRKL